MKLKEIFTEAPIGQTVGQAVGKAAFNVGSQAGKAVGKAAEVDKDIKSVGSAFNQGLGAGKSGASLAPKTASSPFDIIPTNDARNILKNIIDGKPLDNNQLSLLKQVYRKI